MVNAMVVLWAALKVYELETRLSVAVKVENSAALSAVLLVELLVNKMDYEAVGMMVAWSVQYSAEKKVETMDCLLGAN